jgi:hypothetical protein
MTPTFIKMVSARLTTRGRIMTAWIAILSAPEIRVIMILSMTFTMPKFLSAPMKPSPDITSIFVHYFLISFPGPTA